jgi:hypothetical protein
MSVGTLSDNAVFLWFCDRVRVETDAGECVLLFCSHVYEGGLSCSRNSKIINLDFLRPSTPSSSLSLSFRFENSLFLVVWSLFSFFQKYIPDPRVFLYHRGLHHHLISVQAGKNSRKRWHDEEKWNDEQLRQKDPSLQEIQTREEWVSWGFPFGIASENAFNSFLRW